MKAHACDRSLLPILVLLLFLKRPLQLPFHFLLPLRSSQRAGQLGSCAAVQVHQLTTCTRQDKTTSPAGDKYCMAQEQRQQQLLMMMTMIPRIRKRQLASKQQCIAACLPSFSGFLVRIPGTIDSRSGCAR